MFERFCLFFRPSYTLAKPKTIAVPLNFELFHNLNCTAQKQCVCGGSEFAINILKKIGLISEKSRAVPKLESKVYIIVI